jgi:hypothetical protein
MARQAMLLSEVFASVAGAMNQERIGIESRVKTAPPFWLA